ncbi:MAG: isopenicillin N synthase family oxygenase [Marinibacterium sp.]|nr:isopenicillin N synthase family oxygenase [Marinibacterium sp.]
MIPTLDAQRLIARDPDALADLRRAAHEIGLFRFRDPRLPAARVSRVIAAYRGFFQADAAIKARVDMARTGANRGWGAARSEQVDPTANPDFKEVFDSGFELPKGDPMADRGLAVYAPNCWPDLPGFSDTITAYGRDAMAVALDLLRAIAVSLGADAGYFDAGFARPMALLRGNYYPPRPADAGARDFGIAAHSDYGCLTLLATDGAPGLEAQLRSGDWVPVQADPGTFVINFGEMLEIWTDGAVRATPHRVIGGEGERLSIPLFFNPSHDTDVAPQGASAPILAGPYLEGRYRETYLHLKG